MCVNLQLCFRLCVRARLYVSLNYYITSLVKDGCKSVFTLSVCLFEFYQFVCLSMCLAFALCCSACLYCVGQLIF